MNRRCGLLILMGVLLSQSTLAADAMLYPSYVLTSSGELILSIEKILGPHHSALLWGGGGLLAGIPPDRYGGMLSSGLECAAEFRIYLNRESRSSFFSIYCGTGHMYGFGRSEDASGYIGGLKAGFKWNLVSSRPEPPATRISLEPYGSLSLATDQKTWWPNLNLGVRLVTEVLF